ncbi:conserved hypothetical protein [Xanthomonas citri pv. aurantifolii str. ICPB 11122]|nr:conserved hypothetical protein [Xanthomonas citri pv. aurantifolii str. ICPB 11122]
MPAHRRGTLGGMDAATELTRTYFQRVRRRWAARALRPGHRSADLQQRCAKSCCPLFLLGSLGAVLGVQVIGHHFALDLHRHRVAATVARLADLHLDPAFADRVFLHVVAFDTVEAHADAAVEGIGIMERAACVDGQVIGRGIAHGKGVMAAGIAVFGRTGYGPAPGRPAPATR